MEPLGLEDDLSANESAAAVKSELKLKWVLEPAVEHEEVKDWVLAVSVDKDIERILPKDSRGVYEASLANLDGSVAKPCLITGYPVLSNEMSFGSSGRVAIKEDWNKFFMTVKMSKNEAANDVVKFIARWTGTPSSMFA